MPNINKINGLVLCDETNVNGVIIANITNIDGITKNCCTGNGPISLSGPDGTCGEACADEGCGNWYTDGNSGVCPLVNGDILYGDVNCTLAEAGYYSPSPCVEGCDYCYSVNGSGVITVTQCTTCRTISLASSTESCGVVCTERCTTHYTDTPSASSPVVGNHIYTNSNCTCSGGPFPETLVYSNKCGLRSGSCYTVNPSTCAITAIAACR